MTIRQKLQQSIAVAILLTATVIQTTNAAEISWDASSDLTPDQAGFTLYNASSPETPVLNDSVLTISNNSNSERMYYGNKEPSTELEFPDVFEASFRMKYVSGSSSHTGRAPAGVFVTTAPLTGSILYIENDTIFLSESMTSRGPSATVDTNDAFHDYLLRIHNTTVTVYQDGNLVLSGNTIVSAGENGPTARVLFGEVSELSTGTSEWMSFSHNAAIPEPMTAAMFFLLVPAMIFRRNLCSSNKRGTGRLYIQLNHLFGNFFRETQLSRARDRWM